MSENEEKRSAQKTPASSGTKKPLPMSDEATEAELKLSRLSLEVKSKGPLTPETPTTVDIATTATENESDHSENDRAESGAASPQEHSRQTIAVGVAKGPAAFFNLARKFLVTDEEVDLSALEGAIVSAVDAAHLLERSQIATITRIQTSYVIVEPKKKSPHPGSSHTSASSSSQPARAGEPLTATARSLQQRHSARQIPAPGRAPAAAAQSKAKQPMRRARISVTVRRTEAYKKWLLDNPIEDNFSRDGDVH
mmetsp:Transcript_22112/g.52250  ORF Transcript_22112/g.52250 Transcript_22112/m.52250 type:complete len:253 (-) Transcript_22112:105-863(-)